MRICDGLIIMLVVIMTTMGILPAGSAQEPSPSPYAFAYSVTGQEVRVHTLRPDVNVWVQDKLQARVVLGAVRDGLIVPRWSADGQTLFTTIYEPLRDNLAVAIYAYHVLSGDYEKVMEVVDPDAVSGAEYVQIESLSPDGRYAWVTLLIAGESRLLDLQNQTTLAGGYCDGRVLTWLPDEVVIGCTGVYYAEPRITRLSLESGEIIKELLPPSAADPYTAAYVTGGVLLKDGRYLVGSFGSAAETAIGLLDWQSGSGDYIAQGSYLSLSPDEQYAAFFDEGHLWRLDLASGNLRDLGAAVVTDQPLWEAPGTLTFWQMREAVDRQISIYFMRQYPDSLEERQVYIGRPPQRWITAPQGPYLAAEFTEAPARSWVELHDPYGMLWSSAEWNPDVYVSLPFDHDVAWSDDGNWLHLRVSQSPGTLPQTHSLNITTTREVIPAPGPRALLVGETPDGLWWLYEVYAATLDTDLNRLVMLNRESRESAVISEGVPLYTSFGFPAWNFYIFSPPIIKRISDE